VPKGASVLDKPSTLSPEAQVRIPPLVFLCLVTEVCLFSVRLDSLLIWMFLSQGNRFANLI
jgi:hypothetical protein